MKVSYNAKGKIYVIIGSNSGIAQALIESLLEAGATVFGIDIQSVSAGVANERFHYFNGNPLDVDEMSTFTGSVQKRVKYIDGLINLSGILATYKPFEEMTPEEWQETYDISFKSCYNSCKAFLHLLQKAPKAAIVNISSGLAFGGQKNYGPYTTAKAAVISLSRTLATELAPDIRVNTVAPGAVDTNFIYKKDGTTRFNKDSYKKITPLDNLAQAGEIASAIVFLLSKGASHITGQCLHVNGGSFMN